MKNIVQFTSIMVATLLTVSFCMTPSVFAGDHNGLYVGVGAGIDNPTGPNEDGYSLAPGWTIRGGYQFIDYLALELGYDQGIGRFSSPQNLNGSWSFMELPYLNVKPIIPLNKTNNIYFLIGGGYVNRVLQTSNVNPKMTYTANPNIGIDLGIGYEGYLTSYLSLGAEVIYHYFTYDKINVSGGGTNTTVSLPISSDGSTTSVNITLLYHY